MADFTQVPGVMNITTTRDDDVPLVLEWKDSGGLPMNLTGYTFVAAIDGPTDSTLTVTSVDLPNGKISISFPKTVLSTYLDGVYSWYLNWTVGGMSRKALYGKFTLNTRYKGV